MESSPAPRSPVQEYHGHRSTRPRATWRASRFPAEILKDLVYFRWVRYVCRYASLLFSLYEFISKICRWICRSVLCSILIYVCVCISISISIYIYSFIEGSLEVKLPTIWTDEKQSRAEAERRERSEERRVEEKE